MTDLALSSSAVFDAVTPILGTQSLSAGYGSAAQPLPTDTSAGLTVRAKFRVSTKPSAICVIAGELSSVWVGMTTAGFITAHYGASSTEVTLTGSTNLADGTAHEVEFGVNSSGATLLVDGAVVTTSTTTLAAAAPTFANPFGVRAFGSGASAFNGTVDEVAIFAGVQHTAAYTPASTAHVGSEAGLLHVWHLDQSGADSVKPSNVTVAADNAAFLYSDGNWDIQSNAARTSNAGATLSIMFSGATCGMVFDVASLAAEKAQIYYRIDGYSAQSPWTKATVASLITAAMPADTQPQSNPAVAGWPYHLLEIMVKSVPESTGVDRWGVGQVCFKGLVLDSGASLLAPVANTPTLHVLGDSISEGNWNIDTYLANGTDRSDAALSYANTLGELLGVRVSNFAYSGSGMTRGGTASIPACTSTYATLFQGTPRKVKQTPAAILINHGTNDTSATDAAMTTAYTTVLNGLIALYPTVPIICLMPFNGAKASAVQAAIGACTNPSGVSYVDTTGFLNTAYGIDPQYSLHPFGANARAQIAPKVANAIRSIVYGPQNATLVTSIADSDLVTLSRSGAAAQVKAADLKAYLKAS